MLAFQHKILKCWWGWEWWEYDDWLERKWKIWWRKTAGNTSSKYLVVLTFWSFILVSSILRCNSSLLLFCSASRSRRAVSEHKNISLPKNISTFYFRLCDKTSPPPMSSSHHQRKEAGSLTDSFRVSLVCTGRGAGGRPALAPRVADAVGHGGGQAGVVSARQRLEVGLHEPLPPANLVHTLHAAKKTNIIKKYFLPMRNT